MLETIQREAEISFPMLGGLRLDPPAYFTLFGRPIYFYGVLIGLGFLLGITFAAGRAKRFGIKEDDIYDVMLWVIPCSILGARLYYVFFQWDYYARHLNELFAVTGQVGFRATQRVDGRLVLAEAMKCLAVKS